MARIVRVTDKELACYKHGSILSIKLNAVTENRCWKIVDFSIKPKKRSPVPGVIVVDNLTMILEDLEGTERAVYCYELQYAALPQD